MDPVIIMAGNDIVDAEANIEYYRRKIAEEEQRIIEAKATIARRNKERDPLNRSYVMVVEL